MTKKRSTFGDRWRLCLGRTGFLHGGGADVSLSPHPPEGCLCPQKIRLCPSCQQVSHSAPKVALLLGGGNGSCLRAPSSSCAEEMPSGRRMSRAGPSRIDWNPPGRSANGGWFSRFVHWSAACPGGSIKRPFLISPAGYSKQGKR